MLELWPPFWTSFYLPYLGKESKPFIGHVVLVCHCTPAERRDIEKKKKVRNQIMITMATTNLHWADMDAMAHHDDNKKAR